MKRFFFIAATLCFLASCGGNSEPITPDKPDDHGGSQEEQPTVQINRSCYFTKAYVGLMRNETEALELRFKGQKAAASSYESDNAAVATVNASGTVTAVSPGLAKVTAKTAEGKTATVSIRVYADDFVKYVNPTGDKFPVVAWGLGDYGKAGFDGMTAAGVNMAFTWEKHADCYANAGQVKIIGTEDSISKHFKKYGTNPNFGMYVLADEPTGGEAWDKAVRDAASVRSLDKDHMPYVNFNGTASDIFGDAMRDMKVPYLSFDYYPIIGSGVRNYYWSSYQTASKVVNEYAVRLWTFVLSTKHKDYVYPTLDHMRWELYNGLAYGSQAFQYFTWSFTNTTDGSFDYKEGPVMPGNVTTEIYNNVKTLNATLQSLAPSLLGAQLLSIIGDVAEVKYKEDLLPYPLTSVSGADTFTVSHFCKDGKEYALIHNTSYEKTVNLKIGIEKDITAVLAAGERSFPGQKVVALAPGDIALYQL